MPDHVSKTEFKARALEFFWAVQKSGRPVIITDRGKPVLELRPLKEKEKRDPLEILRGSVTWYDHSTDPVGVEDWEALK